MAISITYIAGYPGQQLVSEGDPPTQVVNLSPNIVYLVDNDSAPYTDPNAIPLNPGVSISFDGSAPYWGICGVDDNGNPLTGSVGIIPGSSDLLDPTLLGLSGLAIEIAEQIAENPNFVIPVGAPTALYNVINSETGTPGKFGMTDGTPFGSAADYEASVTAFETVMGFNDQVLKVFFTDNPFPTHPNFAVQTAIALGISVYLIYQPAFDPPTEADQTSMLASIDAMVTAGATVAGIIMYNEPELPGADITGPQYIAVQQYYYAALHSAGYRVISNHSGSSISQWPNYDPGAAYMNALCADFYASSYKAGDRLTSIVSTAEARGIPWGCLEIGMGTGNPTQQDVTNYLGYLTSLVTNTLAANDALEAFAWFQLEANPNSIITSPTDYRVALIQELQQVVTGAGDVPVTIAAGATLVLTPLNPSPNQDYATANMVSYEAFLNLVAGASSTNPLAQISIEWKSADSANSKNVKVINWRVPMANSSSNGSNVQLLGPQHATFLQVSIKNLDSVTCTLNSFQLNGTARTVQNDTGEWDAYNSSNIPTYDLTPGSAAYSRALGSWQDVSVPANDSVAYLISLYAGQAYYRFGTGTSGTQYITVTFQPVPTTEYDNAALLNAMIPSSGELNGNLILPRAPCLVTFTNSDSSAHDVSGIVTTLE